ncbi:MAG: hypothetical protein A2901_01295 [Elusimicrobia bacterium RIFCSPLOWO2_01_FULL_54_10]|nr:MAG: hypothetical protein A2901_01295 [Elusimicrobia bacterium RIFCSPLOWO2_01_FULL_54_10]
MRRAALAVFAASFGIYLFSSAPALAPYRDMGEMVSVSHTLGVAHPPGYPAYALAGKIASLVPLANKSYRVNLLSVLGGAAACAIFFLILIELGLPVALCLLSCVLWQASSSFWIISIVTEMYSLSLAAGMLILYLWLLWERKNDAVFIALLGFAGGLALGIRLDIVLLGPAVFLMVFGRLWKEKRSQVVPMAGWAVAFAVLGFSVFLFLLIRSKTGPLLNWSRPETVDRLLAILMRKSHGGTLDLLSQNYAPGELFWTDMRIYFLQVLKETFWIGIPLALAGLHGLWNEKRRVLYFTVLAWAFSGPFFIYKANMPPNPHALAVLEAHFNLSKAFVYVWIAYGLFAGFRRISEGIWKKAALAVIFPLAFLGLSVSWAQVSKRQNYFGYDYGKNVLKTLPPDSILIMKKDVQLFIFWALQYAEGMRRDVSVVAHGLAGSPWYIQNKVQEGISVKLGPLRSSGEYADFIKLNSGSPIFSGWDHDVPSHADFVQIPFGLLRRLAPALSRDKIPVAPDFLKDFYAKRGRLNYGDQNEFFSADLIDDYSKGHFAREEWDHSIALNSENPSPYYRRGFQSLMKEDYEGALKDFGIAERLYSKTLQQTREFHSLPGVAEGIKGEWAQVLLSMGVAYEKTGRREESERAYLRALEIFPALAQAHYNLSVLYWNRDWNRVVTHLTEALKIDPNHALAAKFLPQALYAQRRSR